MSQCIPWDELAQGYYEGLLVREGRPAKDARLVIGAVIIKHKLSLSDEEAVRQIQENPYLQYFVGLPGYQMEAPFAPSLFVEIRKRMGQSVFEVFHGAIIEAVEDARAKKKPSESKSFESEERSEEDHDDDSPSSSGGNVREDESKRQGKLILDATVSEQAIRYPTDLSLVNEAREFSEQIIDNLYAETALETKPRTYREKARKAYLAVVKQRRPGTKVRGRGIKQQLQYLRRNLGHIERLLVPWPQSCRCRDGCYTATG